MITLLFSKRVTKGPRLATVIDDVAEPRNQWLDRLTNPSAEGEKNPRIELLASRKPS
jgi:hypothetical protein